MAPRAERLPRDLLVQQLRGVPGATHAGAIPQREGQARAGAHAERFGARGRPHADRGHGELSARRRRRRYSADLAALPGWSAGHHRVARGSVAFADGRIRQPGEVTERLNVPVSKTGIRASVSWVRIPPSPPPHVRTSLSASSGYEPKPFVYSCRLLGELPKVRQFPFKRALTNSGFF